MVVVALSYHSTYDLLGWSIVMKNLVRARAIQVEHHLAVVNCVNLFFLTLL